jgi:hypothetical protein
MTNTWTLSQQFGLKGDPHSKATHSPLLDYSRLVLPCLTMHTQYEFWLWNQIWMENPISIILVVFVFQLTVFLRNLFKKKGNFSNNSETGWTSLLWRQFAIWKDNNSCFAESWPVWSNNEWDDEVTIERNYLCVFCAICVICEWFVCDSCAIWGESQARARRVQSARLYIPERSLSPPRAEVQEGEGVGGTLNGTRKSRIPTGRSVRYMWHPNRVICFILYAYHILIISILYPYCMHTSCLLYQYFIYIICT